MTSTETQRVKTILKPIERDLQRVSDRLLATLQHPVARMAVYLIVAGGKRLRPSLVLLAGRSGRYAKRRAALIDLAAAFELIHTATLIHDDIVDDSVLRRRQPTFHHRFGTEQAVLMGDYLYSVAFSMLARLNEPYVLQEAARVCEELSRGEILEVQHRYDVDLTEREYLQIIGDKTASLISACCHLGAHVAGAKPATVERLTRFGWNFGLAFQVMDDCLDLVGDEQTVGKTVRSDLLKGALSLPIIYFAQSLNAAERTRFFAPLATRTADARFLARVSRAAKRTGAIDRAIASAAQLAGEAAGSVDRDGVVLPGAFRSLAQYAVERSS